MVQSILSIGVPNGFENGLFNFGKLLVQTLVAWLGTSAIAANAIIGSIFNITIVPGMGMSLAILTVVGQCIGAGDYQQAISYAKKLLLDHLSYDDRGQPAVLHLLAAVLGLFPAERGGHEIAMQVLPMPRHLLLHHLAALVRVPKCAARRGRRALYDDRLRVLHVDRALRAELSAGQAISSRRCGRVVLA